MKLIARFIFLIFAVTAKGQIAYYDAQKINNFLVDGQIDSSNSSLFVSIIKNYLPENQQNKPDRTILTALVNESSKYYNPFFKDIIPDPGRIQSFRATKTDVVSSSLASLGGLDVTNIADGLAKFIVERAKQELNTYFFEQFREKLKQYIELKTLFPKTTGQLEFIGTEIYNYNIYISNLREAFAQDLALYWFIYHS